MASFLKRVFTSCSNTRACSGPTNVRKTPLKGAPNLEQRRPWSCCEGAQEATLCFWSSLYEELVHGWGCSRPAAPRAIERRGRKCCNAAAYLQASWYMSTTELMALPNRPEGANGVSMWKNLSFSFISNRVNHKYLSARAATVSPLARAVCLVARIAK